MRIGEKTGRSKEEKWKLNGEDIEVVKEFKYLGVWISSNLKWKKMRAEMKTKAMNARKMMGTVGLNAPKGVNANTGDKLYKAMIRSRMDYAIGVWRNVCEEADVMQRKIGRGILRVGRTTANEFVERELGWMKMKDRARRDRLRLFGRIMRYNTKSIIWKVFNVRRREFESGLGGSPWICKLVQDLDDCELYDAWWTGDTRTKKEWKKIVKERCELKEREEARERMNNTGSKLERYKEMKKDFEKEDYLQTRDKRGSYIL
jgi:hypothetical protein